MKTSVALIGFMGAGKTSVGRALAEKLGKEFLDLDALIERKAARTIPEIFEQDGEIGFRELEIQVTREVAGRRNAVITCGGGIVLNRINVDRLKKEAVIVYVKASPATILRRTSADGNERPLLNTPDRASRIREMLRFRRPFYKLAADITIDTTRLDIDSVVRQIIEKLREGSLIDLSP